VMCSNNLLTHSTYCYKVYRSMWTFIWT